METGQSSNAPTSEGVLRTGLQSSSPHTIDGGEGSKKQNEDAKQTTNANSNNTNVVTTTTITALTSAKPNNGSPQQSFSGLRIVAPHTGGPIHSTSINVNDVLCGRGTAHRTHSGNRRYHMLVKHFEPEYSKATCKDDKTKISRAIVAAVRNAKWAGRFLQKCEQKEMIWYELGDRKAWEKTSQLLREYVSMGQHRTAYQSRKYRKDDVEIIGLDDSSPQDSAEDGDSVNTTHTQSENQIQKENQNHNQNQNQSQISLNCFSPNAQSAPEPANTPVGTNTANDERTKLMQSLQAQQQQQVQQIQAQQQQAKQQAQQAQQQAKQQAQQAQQQAQQAQQQAQQAQQQLQQIHAQQQAQQLRAQQQRQQEQQRNQQQSNKGNNAIQTSMYNISTSINNQALAGSGNDPTAVIAAARKIAYSSSPRQPAQPLQPAQPAQPPLPIINLDHGSSITTPNIAKNFPAPIGVANVVGVNTSNKRPFVSTINTTGGGNPSKIHNMLQTYKPIGEEASPPATKQKVRKNQQPIVEDSCMVKKADMDLITAKDGAFADSLKAEVGLWSYEPPEEVMRELVAIGRRYNAQVSVYSQKAG